MRFFIPFVISSLASAAPIPGEGRPIHLPSGDLSGEWLLVDYVHEGAKNPGRYGLTLGPRPVRGPGDGDLYPRTAAVNFPKDGPRPPAGLMLVRGTAPHEWLLDFVYEDRVPVGGGFEIVWRPVRHHVALVDGARMTLVRVSEKGMREVGTLIRVR